MPRRLARSDGRFKAFLSRGRDAHAPSCAPALPVTPFPSFFSSPAWRAISRGPKGPFRVRRSGKARQGQGRCGAHGEAKPQAVRRRACLGSPQGDPPPAGFRGRAQAPRLARKRPTSHAGAAPRAPLSPFAPKKFPLPRPNHTAQAHEPPENTGRNALFAPPRAPQKKFTYPLARPRKIW